MGFTREADDAAAILPEMTGSGRDAVEKATFGAGCFWRVEEEFRRLKGVLSTQVGFMGGTLANPSYGDVCTGDTGHAEVVEVCYDPAMLAYDELLGAFWRMHDPTTLNRQGPDRGSQYRSVIFCHTPEQEAAARASLELEQVSGRHCRPIVTEVMPASTFWRAEEYHQQYLARQRGACYDEKTWPDKA